MTVEENSSHRNFFYILVLVINIMLGLAAIFHIKQMLVCDTVRVLRVHAAPAVGIVVTQQFVTIISVTTGRISKTIFTRST